MRWNQEIVKFFSIVYILFGASAINVLHGPMHFSNLVMENVDWGKFNPATAKINLLIPSVTTLRSLSTSVAVGRTLPLRKPSPLQEHKVFAWRFLIQMGVHRKIVITRMFLRVRCMSLT